ncbi:hypothetical protein GOODEAATRI_007573, partial [Goodea atripinnis]
SYYPNQSKGISACSNTKRQGQVDKQYAGLKELAEDRRKKLKHTYHHFLLCREVEDLEHWIAERDVVASSQEMGQDLDHVTLLRDRFREFARETGMIGQERVDMVNQTIDELIETGHSEAATLAEWKDSINESWADLLELIDTRSQLLTASYDLLKYFDDGKELVAQIHEKQKELPEDVGEDFSKAESFHRMHAAFERDITALGKQVQQFQETAMRLRAQYAGDKQEAIQAMEREVVEAWKGLLDASDGRRTQLVDTAEKFRFFSMVRDLMAWMESIIQQIETQEKPRDVSSVELLQKYHQGIRSEIETRGTKFTDCIDLGRSMLTRKHRDSSEAWLIAQEPYVTSRDLGQTVDEVEKLLKRHEAFEKSTATWEERFSALERLTTLELLALRKQQLELEQFIKDEQRSDKESSSGQLDGTAGDSTVPIVSEIRESASLELEPSVSVLSPQEPERAATMPSETQRTQPVLQEGMLCRKHDMEGSGKKASNRSWNNLYCVLKLGQLSTYKDSKSFGHGVTYHGEDPLSLSNATWEILTNYKKKKHEELQRWSQAMEKAVQTLAAEEGPAPSGSKTHSLPAAPSSSAVPPVTGSAKKDKEKKFSRFAKKK